jgi:hypothetical protein
MRSRRICGVNCPGLWEAWTLNNLRRKQGRSLVTHTSAQSLKSIRLTIWNKLQDIKEHMDQQGLDGPDLSDHSSPEYQRIVYTVAYAILNPGSLKALL